PWVAASLAVGPLPLLPTLTFKPYQGQVSYIFTPVDNDAVYRLSQIVDRNGYATTLAYTSTSSLLRSVSDAEGRALSFSYTVTGTATYLTQVSDPISRTVQFGYD